MKPRTGTDEWSRKQKNCAKMAGAHSRSQFPVDVGGEMVLKRVLKCTETSNVLEKAVSERERPRLPTDVPA